MSEKIVQLNEGEYYLYLQRRYTLYSPFQRRFFRDGTYWRYRRRENSVEETLIEVYPAGVSVRRVGDIIEALWGSKMPPAMIGELKSL